jgi:hypothetical protein
MPDAWMNLTDREAAALGYRIARRAPRRNAEGELAPLALVAVVTLAMLAALAVTSGRHAPSPAADAAEAPSTRKSASVDTPRGSPTQSVPQARQESRPAEAVPPRAEPAALPASREPAREEEPFPSPSVLARGWRCGYLVQPVHLYDGPGGRLIGMLQVNTQLYFSPHAQGCWRELLSKEGRVLGYACLNGTG